MDTFFAYNCEGEILIVSAETLGGAKAKVIVAGFAASDFSWWSLNSEPGIVALKPKMNGYLLVLPPTTKE